MSSNSFVLHFRLTKSCNANCSYCSSAMLNDPNPMTVDDAITASKNIIKYWEKLNKKIEHLTIEYVGGEISMLPIKTIEGIVLNIREIFQQQGIHVHDGVQSNLIASKTKLEAIYSLFNGRVGTSLDNFSTERKLGNSSRRYNLAVNNSLKRFREIDNKIIPAVITVDKNNVDFLVDELKKANKEKRNIVIRPVFQGGSKIESVRTSLLENKFEEVLNEWAYKSDVIVEPFFTLMKKRVLKNDDNYCSWQSNCIKNSLSIEPNGDLYLCQEMADHGYGKIGNILNYQIDTEQIRNYSRRPHLIKKECYGCDYINECQGGCMMHSVEKNIGIDKKTPYCSVWKKLFNNIDRLTLKYGKTEIIKWINSLER